jgi:hypothetical protein
MKELMVARHIAGLLLVCSAVAIGGCGSSETADSESALHTSLTVAEHAHNHPDKGPHGGDVIELGCGEFHAELVHPQHPGEDEAVIVYMLGASAEAPLAIDAKELMLQVKHGGRGEQFPLAAMPVETDAPGTSSRFASREVRLIELLDGGHNEHHREHEGHHEHAEHPKSQLVVKIHGKQYRGEICQPACK